MCKINSRKSCQTVYAIITLVIIMSLTEHKIRTGSNVLHYVWVSCKQKGFQSVSEGVQRPQFNWVTAPHFRTMNRSCDLQYNESYTLNSVIINETEWSLKVTSATKIFFRNNFMYIQISITYQAILNERKSCISQQYNWLYTVSQKT